MLPPVLLLLLLLLAAAWTHDDNGLYTNDWVVRMTGGRSAADQVAKELGYDNLGQLLGFEDTYLMRKNDHPRRSKRHAAHVTKRLADDKRVVWAEQQLTKKRVKRDYWRHTWIPSTDDRFNDDLWPHQWYLHDTRDMRNLPELDLHVTQVWDMGFTGKGVVLTIMDDGLEWNHTDIWPNYDPEASWDSNDNDSDPFPRYDEFDSNNHGTRCAGEIAMVSNNGVCGVGVAYNAKIGGIRLLDGEVNDAVESVSIAFNIEHIDVFSASWGPTDDGMTVDGPRRLAIEALQKGVYQGRDGKGVIYVWASGNGGIKGDNCNCDGYTSSIYTLSIGSASQHGQFPWYGERCSSTMAATYSSGAYTDQKVSTIDIRGKCTTDHTGTSASAPLAAGIVALALEANPSLTWRDMQHLVAWTSDYKHLSHNKGWKRNAAGLMYNTRFGFGLMNAEALVKAALQWTTVPASTSCSVQSQTRFPLPLSSGHEIETTFFTDACHGTNGEINYLEHVEVTVDIEYSNRGVLELFLKSPSGSVTMLLSRRKQDTSVMGFRNWTFLSVHLWGENPAGQWTLLVRDKFGSLNNGSMNNASITLHGTKEQPTHMQQGPRMYQDERHAKDTVDNVQDYVDDFIETENEVLPSALRQMLEDVEKEKGQALDWNDVVDLPLAQRADVDIQELMADQSELDLEPFYQRRFS